MHAVKTQAEERRAKLVAVAFVAAASAIAALGVGLVACESATNLDVRYGDAASAIEGSLDDADAGGEAGAATGVLFGCPCDERAGEGCCMPSAGKPFCTSDQTVCTEAKGTHLRCVGPEVTTESVCCWRGSGAGAQTALAAACDGGPAACTTNTDCAGTGQTCALARCFGGAITIGACGKTPPTCPQP
jgi:hypothetical protein